jgi:hypothetical protein
MAAMGTLGNCKGWQDCEDRCQSNNAMRHDGSPENEFMI